MSGASDKARFYLEQQVPELQDLLRKKLFTEPEIRSIASKRSSFEHILAARGSAPADYIRYAQYEMNLDALRKKRMKRLGVKAAGQHEGQRRIFFILDRGVRKFPGDIRLWMQYVEFCRAQKARKKVKEVFTRLLRLHPTKAELWVLAARHSVEEEGDMMAARGHMQRGLRFCERERALWVEYARLECIYVGKIAARRKVLGLEGGSEKEDVVQEQGGENEDVMALPNITAEDISPNLGKDDALDEVALQNLANTPALTGAIPIAIFDAAMKQFDDDEKLGAEFFDLAAEFDRTAAFEKILRHIVDKLVETKPNTISTITCQFSLPLAGVEPTAPEFPVALGESLQTVRKAMQKSPLLKKQIAEKAILRLLPLASKPQIDPDVHKVITVSLRQSAKALESAERVADMVNKLQQEKRGQEASSLLEIGLKLHGTDERLLQAHALSSSAAG